MATIRRLPSGKFNVQIRVRGTKPKGMTFQTEAMAQAWASEAEREANNSRADELTMLRVTRLYCENRLRGKSSRHYMLQKLERISKSFPQPFLDVTRSELNRFRLLRLSQVSGPTVREELSAINKLYRWAEREMIFGEHAIHSPARNISLPPPSKPRNKIVQRNELYRLMAALGPVMVEIVELAYETAMRRA